MCVEGLGRISRSVLTQDIKMGRCVFQYDVQHQWIAQRQVGHVSVYCDGVRCHVLSVAWHTCEAAHLSNYHCYEQAPSGYDRRCLKETLNPNEQKLRGCCIVTYSVKPDRKLTMPSVLQTQVLWC